MPLRYDNIHLFDEILKSLSDRKFQFSNLKTNLSPLQEVALSDPAFLEDIVENKKYLEKTSDGFYKLTPLGIKVKKAGGHFAYQQQLEIEEQLEKQKRETNDEIRNLNVRLLRFENGQGKNIKLWSLIAAVAAVIVSVASIIVSLYTQNSVINKNTIVDTAKFNQSMNEVEKKIQKLQQPVEVKSKTIVKDTP